MKEIKQKEEYENINSSLINKINSNNDIENQNYTSESEEEENMPFHKIEERRQKLIEKGQRTGISAEAFGRFNKKRTYKPRIIKKTESQKEKIKNKCLTCFLFNNFDDMEISTIVDACEEKKYKKNEYVIKQGDNGDNLYIIESGELICEKVFKEGESPTYLKTYKEGELFGELALLYNAPRAATIYAKTDCVLWALDRLTFNSIIKESSINKREKYKRFLETIPLLSTVESYELYSICDAIKVEKFEKNQYIIKEGEEGDKFYILDEGEAVATKEKMSFKKQYLKGDYFGELALLRNAPRAASVMAVTNCKVLSLDRDAFKRLLGPLKDILKRNSDAYEKYANE